VLESRHVIGLFLLMLLFSGVFFTLGYLMGRDGQVRAAAPARSALDEVTVKPKSGPKPSAGNIRPAEPPAGDPAAAPAPNSDWEFYKAGQPKTTEDHLKPPQAVASRQAVPAVAKPDEPAKPLAASSKAAPVGKPATTPGIPGGGYTLQVAALTRESDALDLALRLQKKKFPASVLSPQADKYFRVQVGPYADQKSAEAAKKGLEAAGFKAFVKH
jgi:cell division septation protein DedD